MNLGSLKPPAGSRKKRKRVGRGEGSGHGGTSCKGAKGQNARSGGGVRPGFEGGQMPLSRRLPKRGFRNPFRKKIFEINIGQLTKFPEGSIIDHDALVQAGLVKGRGDGVKILGKGSIDYPVSLKVDMVSRGAREKIEAAGGSVIEVV
ncbi:MAG: 50S ribosomal protein L15 [Deltaproteobacteria bacterium]|jgi:large subunit ribosomal protein L15|nr:50S ribosomal protein L15 [Deltaproteobacteria bacterium]